MRGQDQPIGSLRRRAERLDRLRQLLQLYFHFFSQITEIDFSVEFDEKKFDRSRDLFIVRVAAVGPEADRRLSYITQSQWDSINLIKS